MGENENVCYILMLVASYQPDVSGYQQLYDQYVFSFAYIKCTSIGMNGQEGRK